MTTTKGALEYFDLQGSTDMVTKTELMQYIRDCGEQISDRNLTYYSSLGLVPPSVRIGTRNGAYPKVVRELLRWIIRSRRYGLSTDAIRQLLPLWELLVRGRRVGCVDLAEFEYVARAHVTMEEANRVVPLLFSDLLSGLCNNCRDVMVWALKDGSRTHSTGHDPLTIGFVLAELDPITGQGREVGWTQLQLPGMADVDVDDPRTVVLGIPNGIKMCSRSEQIRRDEQPCPASAPAISGCAD